MPLADPSAESLAASAGLRREIDTEASGWLNPNESAHFHRITSVIRKRLADAITVQYGPAHGGHGADCNLSPRSSGTRTRRLGQWPQIEAAPGSARS